METKSSNSVKKEKEKDTSNKVRTKNSRSEAALSFDQLLKIAAIKQNEPVKIEKKVEVAEKKGPEAERLMTKKEKEDLLRRKEEERERQLRKEGKLPPIGAAKPPAPALPTTSKDKPSQSKPSSVKTAPAKPNVKPVSSGGSLKSSVRPDQRSTPPVKANNVNAPTVPKMSHESKMAAPPGKNVPGKVAPTKMQSPAMVQSSAPRPNKVQANKGKALAPSGGRPFPPYRETHPLDRPFKRNFQEALLLVSR